MWSLLFMTMIANAMFFGTGGSEARPIGVEVGLLRFTLSQIFIAAMSILIVAPINIIIITLFKRARPKLKVVHNNDKKIKEFDQADFVVKNVKDDLMMEDNEDIRNVTVNEGDSGTHGTYCGIGENDNTSRSTTNASTLGSQTKLVENETDEIDPIHDKKDEDVDKNEDNKFNQEYDEARKGEDEELPRPRELFNRTTNEKVLYMNYE